MRYKAVRKAIRIIHRLKKGVRPITTSKARSHQKSRATCAKPLLVWFGSWFAVWSIWLYLTASFHPTFSLALIVTTSLIVAYAAAAACNHWILLPRLSANGNALQYAVLLAITMAALTAMALTVIRISYLLDVGPDVDPFGVYKHYLIDLFGMAVHVAVAAIVIRLISCKRYGASRPVKHDRS